MEKQVLNAIGNELKKQTPRKIVIRWGDTTPIPDVDLMNPQVKVEFEGDLEAWSR